MTQQVEGYDYREGCPRTLPVARWRDELARVIESGGRRKYVNGETFALDAKGRIVFEVYHRVPPARRVP